MQTVTESETYQNEIGGLDQRISTAESKLTPEAMETTIENSEALSEVRQTADKINWIVESGTSSSNMTLTDDALNVISEGITLTADKINLVANDINLSGNSSVNTIVSNAVDPLETDIDSLTTRMTQAETSITQNTEAIELRATKEEVQTAQDTADFATPITGAEPPEEAPAAGKLWIDEGQIPSVWRRWRGADVPTDREYEGTVSGSADSPAFVAIDNTQGQLQTVALEAGCVAQQAGTGNPSPTNIRAISGRESVEIAACGKNLFEATQNTFSGSGTQHAIRTSDQTTSMLLEELGNDQYVFAFDLETHDLVFADDADDLRKRIGIEGYATRADGRNVYLGSWASVANGKLSANTTARIVTVSQKEAGEYITTTPMYLYAQNVVSGTWSVSNIQLEFGSTATDYEPYRSMGGGVVTPSEPLYGLPDAEDTVEVDASGDVTVTRRTAVVELDGTESWTSYNYGDEVDDSILVAYTVFLDANLGYQTSVNSHFKNLDGAWHENTPWTYSDHQTNHNKYFVVPKSQIADIAAWKSWLAAQKAAGTPVTVVYELAAPETEALTAISPITPEAGPVNIWTDADALTATVRGSGWEIINDTDGLSADIQEAQDDISGMVGSIDTIENNISAMASQILTPDQIISTVVESTDFQTVSTQVIQTGEGLAIVQTTVDDLGDRVDVIEGAVVIQGANIDIGRSDSNTKLHLDNEG